MKDDVVLQTIRGPIRPRCWFKSRASSAACACIEVRFESSAVSIRDTKDSLRYGFDPDLQPTISVSVGAWCAFLDEVMGEAALGANHELTINKHADGTVSFLSNAQRVELVYTSEEWTAFVSGVEAGEFTPELEPV